MKNYIDLINDLRKNPDILWELVAVMIATPPGDWQALEYHLMCMGYEIDTYILKRKIHDIASNDQEKVNQLMHDWARYTQ